MSATTRHLPAPAWKRISLAELKAGCIDSVQVQRQAAHRAVDAHFDRMLTENLKRIDAIDVDDEIVEH